MINGNIFDIQRFSIHDGPGIRTTVFVKGCNLRCLWCHNPESQESKTNLLLYADKCKGCGKCKDFCQKAFTESCIGCGKCSEVCRFDARTKAGREETAAEVFATVIRDKDFYATSGGGITVSGGEPMLQPDFVKELFSLCKEAGIHTAIETAGNVDFSRFEDLIPLCDLFLFDIKGINEDKHIQNTGVSNKRILENAEKLKEKAKDILFRMPYIPGYNDDELPEIRKFTEGYKLELMAYHSLGESKYRAMKKDYVPSQVEPPKDDFMINLATEYGTIYHGKQY